MPKLNDTQSVLLATAAQRDSGSLYPLPESVNFGPRIAAAVGKLLSSALVEERETVDAAKVHRTDGDLRFGLFITPAGLQAIGVEAESGYKAANEDVAPSPAPTAASPRETKASQVLALLSRAEGATLAQMVGATGWLPHTTRAALTGLRKKGHGVQRGKRGEETCYRVAAAEAA